MLSKFGFLETSDTLKSGGDVIYSGKIFTRRRTNATARSGDWVSEGIGGRENSFQRTPGHRLMDFLEKR
jgi:hypothetical protein